jgi:hypothetical protein
MPKIHGGGPRKPPKKTGRPRTLGGGPRKVGGKPREKYKVEPYKKKIAARKTISTRTKSVNVLEEIEKRELETVLRARLGLRP